MAVMVKRKKIVKECDGGACATPSAPYSSAATNINGMGNPVPPSETSCGSGDSFGNIISKPVTQARPKYKLKRKK